MFQQSTNQYSKNQSVFIDRNALSEYTSCISINKNGHQSSSPVFFPPGFEAQK